MNFTYNDGGRAAAGYKGRARDCVARSVAIASGKPYTEVYDRLADGMATQRKTRRSGSNTGVRSARNGVNTKRLWFKRYMAELGFTWVPTNFIGSAQKMHFSADEFPQQGTYIVSLSRHYTTVIDGVINDTYDPSINVHTGELRMVYGYWRKA